LVSEVLSDEEMMVVHSDDVYSCLQAHTPEKGTKQIAKIPYIGLE
jgi:hypothetical protein